MIMIKMIIFFILFVSILKLSTYINLTSKTVRNERIIKYLEYSIIGENSPFNNYKSNSDFTLLSANRFKNIKYIVQQIIKKNIQGDILEAGNWRGGSMLYAKGLLDIYGINDKEIWMFDTFSGFPKNSNITHKTEKNLIVGKFSDLMRSNSVKKVKELFQIYNLSKGINLIAGLFEHTIPYTNIPKLSYLRLDADSYINTKFLLDNLYNKLNYNGYVEFDDYGAYPGCKKAVDEFRKMNNIKNSIIYEYEPRSGNKNYYEAIYWIKGR